jgi:hypothetical protein
MGDSNVLLRLRRGPNAGSRTGRVETEGGCRRHPVRGIRTKLSRSARTASTPGEDRLSCICVAVLPQTNLPSIDRPTGKVWASVSLGLPARQPDRRRGVDHYPLSLFTRTSGPPHSIEDS